MKNLLRSLIAPVVALAATAAWAQPAPPYMVTINGYVMGCTPMTSVNILTVQNTQPPVDMDVALDGNCGFSVTLEMESAMGWFVASTPCLGAIQSQTLAYTVNSANAIVLSVTFNCGNTSVDCLGISGGSALPGTPCSTFAGVAGIWSADCVCETNTTVYDCLQIPNGPNMPGTPCTTPNGATGTWSADCQCVNSTTVYDCLGIANGPNVAGTPCWIMGSNYVGTWDGNCDCVNISGPDCQAGFWAMQAYEIDPNNPNGGGAPIPYEVWVWNLSSGSGNVTYSWDFGDGNTSTDPYPTHTYDDAGPYQLCLTISDGTGCTDQFCDEITIDGDGILEGMILENEIDGSGSRQNGFTINVQNPLTMGVNEAPAVNQTAIWPNPVTDQLNLSFNTSIRGSLPVSVMDVEGRVLRTSNERIGGGLNRFALNVADLAPGIYVVRFGSGDDAVSLRFVKR